MSILFADGIFAQPSQLYFNHLTAEDGLSQGVVNNILVDKRGFAWFTTYDGINRFDGTHCISNEQIGPGLEGISMTRGLVEDSQGDIWFGSEGALIQYSYKKNHFRKYHLPDDIQASPTKLSFYDPIAVHENTLFINGGYGVKYLYDIRHNKWTRLCNPEDPEKAAITDWKVPDLARWFSPHLMLYRFIEGKHLFYRIITGPSGQSHWQEQSLIDDSFHSAGIHYPLNDSVMLLTTAEHTVWAYHYAGNRLEKLSHVNIPDVIMGFYQDKSQCLWIVTQKEGIFVYDLVSRQITRHYPFEESNVFSLMNVQISAIHISDDRLLWVSSWGKGLNFCRLSDNGFSHQFTKEEAKANKTDNYVRGIVQAADGHFYCNTQFGGLVELDEDLQFIRTITVGTSNTVGINAAKTKLYFGDGGLYTYDIGTKTTTLANTGINTDGADTYYFFSQLKHNRMLACTLGAVWAINDAGNRFDDLPGLNNSSFKQPIFAYEDRHGLIYKYSISHGLELYKMIQGRYSLIFTFPVKFIAKYILEEGDTTAWIATSYGLYLFDPVRLKILKHYTVADGLPNNVVYALADDGLGRLWMSTNKGLSMLNKSTGRFKNYAGSGGMQGNEYNSHTVVTAKDGRIIFGGVNGLTVIRPREIKTDSMVPVVQFTSIKADSSINPYQFGPGDTWELKPGSNTVEFSFTAIDFMNPKGCSMKYRLKGYDKEWVTTGNPGNARYVKLPPGQYTFEVMAANADGVWGREVRQLQVQIAAWWWQQWWFTVLAIVVTLVIIMLLVRQYIRQKLYRQRVNLEQQLAVARERERIITDLHDDVGATLSSMHIYGDLARESWENQPQESRKMIEKISSTSRDLMNKMGDIIWSMKPAGEENHSFEARIKNYINELLSPKNIHCDVMIDQKLASAITDPEARKNILLIVKEAINNVAKYSDAEKAIISLLQQNGDAVLTINDDGRGFDSSAVIAGNGLSNMKRRCEQLGGTCEIGSMPGKGVSVICRFPLAIISHT